MLGAQEIVAKQVRFAVIRSRKKFLEKRIVRLKPKLIKFIRVKHGWCGWVEKHFLIAGSGRFYREVTNKQKADERKRGSMSGVSYFNEQLTSVPATFNAKLNFEWMNQ